MLRNEYFFGLVPLKNDEPKIKIVPFNIDVSNHLFQAQENNSLTMIQTILKSVRFRQSILSLWRKLATF